MLRQYTPKDKAPFTPDGSLQHYPERIYNVAPVADDNRFGAADPEWRDIESFTATLQLEHLVRGRSAAYFIWRNTETGATYPMFMKELTEFLLTVTLEKGRYAAWWRPVKRGQNYGIKFIGEATF